jgi:asparagine synthetase B (glutamine-hydrolysing)
MQVALRLYDALGRNRGIEEKARLFSAECWRDLERQRSERLLDGYFSDGSAVHALDCMLHADLATWIADDDLPTTDRLSMVHSLELRSPLLDRRVAELAMHALAHWKSCSTYTRAARRITATGSGWYSSSSCSGGTSWRGDW